MDTWVDWGWRSIISRITLKKNNTGIPDVDMNLFSLVADATPKFNPTIMNGLAVEQMKGVESYVDSLFRSISKSFPEELKYVGYSRCTPQEEYQEITRKRNNRYTIDIARSDFFMIKYMFRYNGEDLPPRYVYLPFVRQGGLITIRGSTFSVSPVIADRAISFGSDSIFIPVQVAKLTFERIDYKYNEVGSMESESADQLYEVESNVAWSTIYNQGSTRRKVNYLVKAKHTLGHYLFCKYGVTESFQRLAPGCDVRIGMEDTINYDRLERSEWVICESTKVLPRTLRVLPVNGKRVYYPSNIRLAVRKDRLTVGLQALIASFFYLADHFPDRIEPEYVDNERLWRVLMGYLIFGTGQSEAKLSDDVDTHIESLDEYMDERSRQDLSSVGVEVEDIYELFNSAIEMLSEMVIRPDNVESTMYDKELMVLRYALFDINKAISHFKFTLQKVIKKTKIKEEIITALRTKIGQEEIAKMNRGHGEVAGISSPGDNLYFKVTSILVPQTSATGGGRGGKKTTLTDPSKYLHASIAEVGSYTNLPKTSPDGRTRVNMYLELEEGRRVKRNQRFVKLINATQRKIQHMH